jgi:hypothetical protein
MQDFIDFIARYRKAVVGFLAPGIVILGAPLTQGHAPVPSDWFTALGAVLLTSFGVAAISNRQSALVAKISVQTDGDDAAIAREVAERLTSDAQGLS